MKNILLGISLLFFISARSQNVSLVFFATEGEKFWLIIDGQKINSESSARVEATNVERGRHTVKIRFEDPGISDVNEDINTIGMGGEVTKRTYAIVKGKNNQYVLKVKNTEVKDGTNGWVALAEGLNKVAEDEKRKNDEANSPPCEKQDYGTVIVTNNSSYPYNVSTNEIFTQRLQGGNYVELKLKPGQYTLKAEQVSGYVMYPTVKTITINVNQCQASPSWSFPR